MYSAVNFLTLGCSLQVQLPAAPAQEAAFNFAFVVLAVEREVELVYWVTAAEGLCQLKATCLLPLAQV
jgi:hypothetical protein